MKASSLISSVGVIIGTLIPGFIIILPGIIWLALGNPSEISFLAIHLIPDLEASNLVFFSGVLLGLAGMEVATFHASEVKNPQAEFPKAIFYATLIILAVFLELTSHAVFPSSPMHTPFAP